MDTDNWKRDSEGYLNLQQASSWQVLVGENDAVLIGADILTSPEHAQQVERGESVPFRLQVALKVELAKALITELQSAVETVGLVSLTPPKKPN